MIVVGTSGWQYKDWREAFYPREIPQRQWLAHYAQRFVCVEVNNTFYRLPERSTFEGWRDGSPDDFVFVCKVSRYLTHVKRLNEPEEPVQRFMDRAAGLGPKLGPLLIQLPPNLQAAPEKLDHTLGLFPGHVKVAVEFRHETWFTDEVRDVLVRHGAALVWADRHSRDLNETWVTAEWGYVRLHEGSADPWPCYGRGALDTWARRIAETWGPARDVFVFFNNDPRCCAVDNARTFAQRAVAHGLSPTRVPAARDVRVWR